MSFRLTYATMFDPPPEMHERFDAALVTVRSRLGGRHPLFLNGVDTAAAHYVSRSSPIDSDIHLGEFAVATEQDAHAAMDAAHRAFPAWRATPASERVRLLRRVADVMEARVYEIAAALALEVGKNRMEALGEAQETVDFFRHYADDFEQHGSYEHELPNDPLPNVVSRNRSVMRPYGAWVVIAPFNFPLALAGGPTAAALVTGNTVVVKGATDTPWAGRLLADCIRDAGLPPGVFQYLSGSGREVGEALSSHRRNGGHHLHRFRCRRHAAAAAHGVGTVATSVHRRDGRQESLHRHGAGRSRRCRRRHRALGVRHGWPEVLRPVAPVCRPRGGRRTDRTHARADRRDPHRRSDCVARTGSARSSMPTRRRTTRATCTNSSAGGATLITGAGTLDAAEFARGHYVRPVLAEAPLTHPLWRHEMFLPILMLHRVRNRDEAMQLANDTNLGLTAGFYGDADEVPWFHENIEAGVTYANRRQGATTGAWPGYQPFGGWKGSGSTGKAIASFYYLAQYQREQSRTVVES